MALISTEVQSNSKINAINPAQKANMNEGRINYEKIRNYDFKNTSHFTKDQIKALRGIYENFSISMSSYLSDLLRRFCQVELDSVEEHTFSVFIDKITDPLLLPVIELSPMQGVGLMGIPSELTYCIIDRLMGGSGQCDNYVRNYTEIELALMEKLTKQLLEIMKESWSEFVEIEPHLEKIETRSQFAQVFPLSETIAIIRFNVKIGEEKGLINFCIPYVVVETLLRDVKTKSDLVGTTVPVRESKAAAIKDRIEKTELDIVATFMDTSISAKEVLSLQQGDVLVLDHKVNDAINVKIKGLAKFKSHLGIRNNRRSVKLTAKVNEEDFNK